MTTVVVDENTPETTTKGERTARRLLEIAISRFGDRGFRATSVSEIAREAGLTQAAVYAYYDSKTALFDAAVDHDAELVITETQQNVTETDPLSLIPALLLEAGSILDEHPLLRRVLRGEEPEALVRVLRLPALADFTAYLRSAIERAQADGAVRAEVDPARYAEGAETIVLALLLGMEQLGHDIDEGRRVAVARFFADTLRPTA